MSSDPFFADSLARAVCYVISENLLSIIPDIDDYTCPVCASLTFKPGKLPILYHSCRIVRLACSHVFCIRCLVMLQRQRKAKCPICRAEVVLQADSGKKILELLWSDRKYRRRLTELFEDVFPTRSKGEAIGEWKSCGNGSTHRCRLWQESRNLHNLVDDFIHL